MLRTIAIAALFAIAPFTPAVAQDAPPPKPVYLAVGDSLTAGLYATDGHGWAYMVADALPGYQLEVVRAPGVDNAIDFLPDALATYNPELVTIEVGINNINYIDGGMDDATFLARYVTLLSMLHDAGTPNVIACTVPWTGAGRGTEYEARALQFNRIINFAVPMFGFTVADCWGATFGRYDYLSHIDGFHPNDAGHRAIADAVLRVALPLMCKCEVDDRPEPATCTQHYLPLINR